MTNLINETGRYTLPSTWSHIRFYVFMEISVVQAFHIYVCIVFFFLGGLPSESPSYLHVHQSPNHILRYLTHVTDHV